MTLQDIRRGFEPVLRRFFHLYWRFARGMTLGVRGVVLDGGNRVFLVKHSYVAGWHLPGGGVEVGETFRAALQREFAEELGVTVLQAEPWCCVEHVYPHAHVHLHFYIIRRWAGEPQSLEGQAFAWQGEVAMEPVLPATIPLLEWLYRVED